MKSCSGCRRSLPNSQFKTALYKTCKRCLDHRKQYRMENRELVKSQDRKYKETHQEQERARSRIYYANNADKCREASRKYRAAHPEAARESQKKWREQNAEHIRATRRAWYAANIDRERRRNRASASKHKTQAKERYAKWYALNHERELSRARQWYAEHCDYAKERSRQWHLDHPDQSREISRNSARRIRAKLPDGYIRQRLVQGTAILAADVPDEMVELYRTHLKLKRSLKEKKG